MALVGWILLIVLPGRRWVTHVATTTAAVIFAMPYIAIMAVRFAGSSGGYSSLAEVMRLFSDPWLVLAGWLHYLAFDLLIGSWEVRDARERGVPHWFVVPCLFVTFMFGPAGWLAYMALRTFFGASRP